MRQGSRCEAAGFSLQTPAMDGPRQENVSDPHRKDFKEKFLDVARGKYNFPSKKDEVRSPHLKANSELMTQRTESPRSGEMGGYSRNFYHSPTIKKTKQSLNSRPTLGSGPIDNQTQSRNDTSLSRIQSFLERIVYTEEEGQKKEGIRLSDHQREKFKQASQMIGKQASNR